MDAAMIIGSSDSEDDEAGRKGTPMVVDAAAAPPAADAPMVFGSSDSEDEAGRTTFAAAAPPAAGPRDVAGTLRSKKRTGTVAFGPDFEGDEGGPSGAAATLAATLAAGSLESGPERGRGLLSEMVHAVLGEPALAATAMTAAISAKSGWPAWARKFSNLYGVVGDDGSPIVPENAYQCARWSPEFKTIVDWWMHLPPKPESGEAAPATPQSKPTNKRYALAQLKCPARPIANASWDGVDGIFAKMLTTALTKREHGVRVLEKGDVAKKRVVKRWCEQLQIRMPTLRPSDSERLQAVMRDAVRAKLMSSAFQDMLRPHLVGPDSKLPFWVAEKASNAARGGANVWTLPTGFPPEQIVPKEEKSARARRK
jgi:hypothetical protein